MTSVFSPRELWRRLVAPIDPALMLIVGLLLGYALLVLASASSDRLNTQLINLGVALVVMRIAAQIPPQRLMHLALPLYIGGLLLLVAVALFGDVTKGARRWLNLGFMRIQPSEIMKIAMPLMLAWYFQKHEALLRWKEYVFAALILAAPVALIARQPDLGTAILVLAAGFYVIFLAGLSWKVLATLLLGGLASLPVLWSLLHDYQRNRILTLLDPEADPLGKGFHIIQSTIAVGSGGILGKGWGNGTQTHLEFIPERHTDFIFAVLSEEFGLIGNTFLLALYALLIGRGLMIAGNAPTLFSRLMAGSITLIFFTYALVNMGMVSGVLPVVGVPLPFVSYGGTALVTLFLGVGILMSIHKNRMLVQK
ncbi:MAG: rod shape-determining protein RodA [Rhodocyclaceae bacterium]|jgi:rod shape determining protein RodA|nr:rod shape-determining protein RodA [Rhodocyclaceae bacterium]